MGNCQAIDNASFVLQHPTGKVERLYSAITAGEVMKANPGHYVALLLTTTLYSSRHPSATKRNNSGAGTTTTQPLRVTRIKLLRHTESLTVGHIYRLVTTKEVMKGLMAKKNGKTSNNVIKPKHSEELPRKHEAAAVAVRSNQLETTHQQMRRPENNGRGIALPVMKPRGWHPSLNSISEASN